MSDEQKSTVATAALFLVALDVIAWWHILFYRPPREAHAYFLDVGQGDAELVIFPGNVKVMTDAGPDDSVLRELEKVLPEGDRYIDIAFISHPQLDHFGGYNYILDHYSVGAFIYNGRNDTPGVAAWPALLKKIREKHIPLLTLGRGDGIKYGENEVKILSPDAALDKSPELNDTAFVERVSTPTFKLLLTADAGMNIENFLLEKKDDIFADILKVGHHGSRFSSGAAFLHAVNPALAVIEVGAHNHYGHPTRQALARLKAYTHAVLARTDRDHTVEAWMEGGRLMAIRR